MRQALFLTMCAFAIGGCKNSDEPSPAPAVAEETTAAAPPPAATTKLNASTDDIPTPADFEEKAEAEVTNENLEQTLDDLEKEITDS